MLEQDFRLQEEWDILSRFNLAERDVTSRSKIKQVQDHLGNFRRVCIILFLILLGPFINYGNI
jgi:hypothetical protein